MQPLVYCLINELRLSSHSVLFIEFLSSSQIIHLVLKGIANSGSDNQSVFYAASKNIAFLSGAHNITDSETSSVLVKPLWILCISYFAIISLLAAISGFLKTQGGKPRYYFFKGLGLIFLLHSRIISFPIQFFLLSLTSINDNENTSMNSTSQTDFSYRESGFVGVTALLIVVNSLIAFIQEFVLYQISNNKNYYAVKTNLYHQIMVVYKCFGLILCFLGHKYQVITQINSILHLLLVISLLYVLYTRLPFYKFRVLKATIIFNGLLFPLSVVSIIQAFSTDREVLKSLEIFLVFAPGIIIKFLFTRFQKLFEKILRGESKSPEHIIHFALLLQELISSHCKKSFTSKDRFKPNKHYLFGILAGRDINFPELENSQTSKNHKSQVYAVIAEKLKESLILYPTSKLLLIFKAHVHLTKLNQVGRALELIKRVEAQGSSVSIKRSVAAFYVKLNRVYSKRYLASDTLKELRNYFTYTDIASSIKKDIAEEVEKQLEFWQDIQKGKLNVKKTIEKVEKIDVLWGKIQRQIQSHSTEFTAYCSNSLLMYAVYLYTIRQLPQEGVQMTKRYKLSLLNGSNRDILGLCSRTVCVAAISLDKQRIGEIINVSGLTQDFFRVKKNDLIGRNFTCLFPTAIARNYTNMLQQYLKGSQTNLDFKDRLSYGKVSNGDMFELQTHFQLYPYMNKELTVAVLLKKLSSPKMVLIANCNGSIVEYSKSLQKHFLSESIDLNSIKNLQDLSTEFEPINAAFNIISSSSIQPNQKVYDEPSQFTLNALSQITYPIDDRTPRGTNTSPNRDTERQPLTRTPQRSTRDLYCSTGTGLKTLGSEAIGPIKAKNTYEMSLKEAQKIVDKYVKGHQITLNCVGSNSYKKGVLSGDVQVKPYVLEEGVYKIVTLTNFERGKLPMSRLGSESYRDKTERDSFCESLSVGEFVAAPRKEQRPAESEVDSISSDEKPGVIRFETLGHQEYVHSEEQVKKDVDFFKKIENDEQANSVMDAQHKETRVAKALKAIWTNNKIHPLLKYSIAMVYLIIAGIVLLTFVNHRFSKSSILELEKSISVVNTATLRMQDMITVWQFGLILHQVTAGLQYYPSYITDVVKVSLAKRCLNATQHNNQLKNELSGVQEPGLINRAFLKDVKIWSSAGGDYQQVDNFFANDMLISKYLDLYQILGNGNTTRKEETDMLFRNTANEYMVTSLDIIAETEAILQTIISRNMTSLQITLGFEISTLVLLLSTFVFASSVTLNSHKRLFRALSRTQEANILERLRDIKKVKMLLEEDVETKIFYDSALGMLEDSKSNREVVKSGNLSKDQHFEMKHIKLYIVGRILFASVFLPLFAALFVTIFSNSRSTFERLENESHKISVLSQTSYQEDIFLNTLLYETMYQNDTDMTFLNQPSRAQLVQNIERVKESNGEFSSIFIAQNGDDSDPIIETVLKNELCSFVDAAYLTQQNCAISMRGGKIGLLSIKSNILQASIDTTYLYFQNSTFENAKVIMANYNLAIASDLATVHAAYIFLTEYMLDKFAEKVRESLKNDLLIYMSICVVTGIYILYVHVVCLAKIKAVDLSRRKILKIIPTSTIQENRVMSFYLIKDFGKEIEGIKNIL